ncbi:MAG: ATP-binding protein [Acutalibacter sp.]|jgi:signal transduction histidine kinase
MGGRRRRALGIGGQILLGFGVLIVVVAALLWLFQMVLLDPFYRAVQVSRVKATAESVEHRLDDQDMKEQVRQLCLNSGINIVVTDEMGQILAGWKSSQKESYLENISGSRTNLYNVFNEVNLQGGSRMTMARSPFVNQDGSQDAVILYVTITRTPAGLNRMVMLESVITPVDSVKETLLVQVTTLMGVMVLLSAVLALVISRRIARPITAINEGAKILAKGDYAIRFEEHGAREVRELAQTLNYAAGELSKVEGLRRDLLANVSHDLRTPLTMIKGYGEVMRDLPGENTPENVQIIIDEAERLTNLVNDLLDLSKLEAGVLPLEKTRFNLTESIRQILHRYDKLADYRFPFRAAEEVWVNADELKISQVVYNLVNNAITYSGEDKTITLEQTVQEGKVRVSVTDTGEGIPQEKLKDIWERYYKVDKEHKRAQMGSGLGLSIVKNILDLHGGTYGVTSQLGKGSTFWFELPVDKSEEGGET